MLMSIVHKMLMYVVNWEMGTHTHKESQITESVISTWTKKNLFKYGPNLRGPSF